MDSNDIGAQQGSLSLGRAFLYWLACSALLAAMVYVAYAFRAMPLVYATGFYYLVVGFALSRGVLRRLIRWLPYYYTLANVTRAKLHFFFFWPFAYPFLFARLAVNKAL
jgi:hypothetical protein